MGKEIRIVSEEQRIRPEKSEVERLWADNRKARQLLGWEPAVGLDEGLKEAIRWYSQRENPEFFKEGIYTI
jgi:dTDP-glucose 4,6-dehydratase